MTGHDAHPTRRGVSAAIVAAIPRDADAFLTYPYTQTERTVGVMKFCHLPAQGVETYISCDLFQRQWRGQRYELVVAGRVYGERLGYACGVVATEMLIGNIRPRYGLIYPDVFQKALGPAVTTSHGVFSPASWWGEMFADINLGPRQKLTMVHLMPITDAEARLVARKGFPAFIDRFGLGDGFEREHVDESLLVDVMDLHRLDDLGVESS